VLTDELLDDLLDLRYGQRRTFAFLALLFPHVDTRNVHHVDHVFPKALLRKPALRKLGQDDAAVDEIQARQDLLSNLQLLEGSVNIDKSATAPAVWVAEHYGSGDSASAYLARNAIPALPKDASGFLEFFAARRELLRTHIRRQLGGPPLAIDHRPAASPELTETSPESPLSASSDVGPPVATAPAHDAVPTFAIVSNGAETAWGRPADADFVVQAGSRARQWITRNSGQAAERVQSELVASGVLVEESGHLAFIHDHRFSSVSGAAAVVLGRSSRGPTEWRISGTSITFAQWSESR
jgi:hypothetical protein